MSYMKPNIKLGTKNINYAVWGHMLSLFGSLFAVVWGLITLIGGQFNGLIGLLGGIFILLIEIGKVKIPQLDDPIVRGIVWILLAAWAGTGGWFTGLAIIVGGIFYILHKMM